ncbi:hypothetical protein [Streptomyces sp. ISL-43]|nr:hypothetical protein [Streptomyces sp. ISL-43]
MPRERRPLLWQRPGFWQDYFRQDPQAPADFETVTREPLDDTVL